MAFSWCAPLGDVACDVYFAIGQSKIALRLQALSLTLDRAKSSANSLWVRMEVESALEREDCQHAQVLFPVRLDDAVMERDKAMGGGRASAAPHRRLLRWKDHDRYQKVYGARSRVLR